jgi:hypothetical protein
MSSIVSRRYVQIVLLATAAIWTSPAVAATAQDAVSLVARLYKDFAWQAIVSQPGLFGEDLSHQPKPVLERYFDAPLASLLANDAACQARVQGICNLDFDLLFDSQDPSVIDLEIKALAAGAVSVEFKNPISNQKTKISFRVATVSGNWKITDVFYHRSGGISLKTILMHKIP